MSPPSAKQGGGERGHHIVLARHSFARCSQPRFLAGEQVKKEQAASLGRFGNLEGDSFGPGERWGRSAHNREMRPGLAELPNSIAFGSGGDRLFPNCNHPAIILLVPALPVERQGAVRETTVMLGLAVQRVVRQRPRRHWRGLVGRSLACSSIWGLSSVLAGVWQDKARETGYSARETGASCLCLSDRFQEGMSGECEAGLI